MDRKTIIGSVSVGLALVGGFYGGWAVLSAVMAADPLTKFLIGVGSLGGFGTMTILSIRK